MNAHGSSLGGEGKALFPVLFLVLLVCCLKIFISVAVLLLLTSVVIGIFSLFPSLSFVLLVFVFFLSVVVVLLRSLSF